MGNPLLVRICDKSKQGGGEEEGMKWEKRRGRVDILFGFDNSGVELRDGIYCELLSSFCEVNHHYTLGQYRAI